MCSCFLISDSRPTPSSHPITHPPRPHTGRVSRRSRGAPRRHGQVRVRLRRSAESALRHRRQQGTTDLRTLFQIYGRNHEHLKSFWRIHVITSHSFVQKRALSRIFFLSKKNIFKHCVFSQPHHHVYRLSSLTKSRPPSPTHPLSLCLSLSLPLSLYHHHHPPTRSLSLALSLSHRAPRASPTLSAPPTALRSQPRAPPSSPHNAPKWYRQPFSKLKVLCSQFGFLRHACAGIEYI